MKSISFSIVLATLAALASTVVAVPPFNSGSGNIGTGEGQQFITGQCVSDADCASGCCAFPTGICSGPDAAFQDGKQGCGFFAPTPVSDHPTSPIDPSATPSASPGTTDNTNGTPASSDAPAATPAATPGTTDGTPTAPGAGGPAFDPAGAHNVGNGAGAQFIGGQCLSAADCASGCCAGPSGICSGPAQAHRRARLGVDLSRKGASTCLAGGGLTMTNLLHSSR
ncbi:hypothetical protein DL93DRAFT_301837 [Clavulina sp. PMI_390]|nr:hypothetical protein DL93DRAFT_301837 [Clavulina sp. PMI_390]